jgi:hypothetical protein
MTDDLIKRLREYECHIEAQAKRIAELEAGEIGKALVAERDEARRERDAWIETARQHARNEEYYASLIDEVAPMLGSAMYTQDDGGVVPEPLRACLPKAVAQLAAERDEARARIAELEAGLRELYPLMAIGKALATERNEAREAVKRLAGALEDVLDWDAPAWDDAWASAWQESKDDGRAALSDPIVKRIVEGE